MLFDTQTATAHAAVDQLQADANTLIDTLDQEISVANAQITADQTTIASVNAALASTQATLATTQQSLAIVQKQLTTLQSVNVYDRLERNPFNVNFKAEVGGSGLGAVSQRPPGIECAELAILPDIPIPISAGGTGKNYFDSYFTQDFPLDDTLTKFKLEASFLFPTLADSNASQCLEMESRHVLTNGNMYIIACQLDFADKVLRIFDHTKKWFPIGVAQTRLVPNTWYEVILEGHHDATTIYYDGVTINGTRVVPVGQGAMFNLGWKRMNRVALQLDGNGAGTPYRVKIDNVRLTVS